MTLLALCAGNFPVTGEFPTQRPVTRSFDFFYLRLNKRLNKSGDWWSETPSRWLWRHGNVEIIRQIETFWQKLVHLTGLICMCLVIYIARRHGHVFRMALHNEGDWQMETWQRACRASCHVSILQSPSCVMPFWTHAKCLLAFISYLPMWIKAKYTFIKTVYSPRFYGGPYLQAKHADVCSGVLFWTVCTRHPHVLSLPSSSGCEKSDSWRQARSVKTAKKSHERYHNVVMWHWIVYKWRRSNKMLSFRRTFFKLLDFTVSLSYRDWHSETPWSHSSNQPGGTYCQAQDFLLRTN